MTCFPAVEKTRSGVLMRESRSVTERRGDSVREKDQVLPLVVWWRRSTTKGFKVLEWLFAVTTLGYFGMVKGIMHFKPLWFDNFELNREKSLFWYISVRYFDIYACHFYPKLKS